MSKFIKKANFWVRRKSYLPLILIGTLVVLVLFFNEDTSLALNMKYEKEIRQLTEEIELCRDSARYYRTQRESILRDNADLEHIAREKFHMQKPTEDVYILTYK